MAISEHGFTSAETEAGKITAYIAVWHERHKKKGGFSLDAGSYGIVLAGLGTERILWGAGYTTDPTPMAAFGVQRLLTEYPSENNITVLAHPQLLAYVGLSPLGFVRKPSFKGPAVYREILAAMDEQRWAPLGVDAADHHYLTARSIATGPAKQAALAHKNEHDWSEHDHPVNNVVSTGP